MSGLLYCCVLELLRPCSKGSVVYGILITMPWLWWPRPNQNKKTQNSDHSTVPGSPVSTPEISDSNPLQFYLTSYVLASASFVYQQGSVSLADPSLACTSLVAGIGIS